MSWRVMIGGLLLGSAFLSSRSAAAQSVADEAAIRARLVAHGQASAAGDARALSEVYADDAELVSSNGSVTTGRQAIDALWQRDVASGTARGGRHHVHPLETVRIRFLSTDVALVDVGSRNQGGRDSTGAALPSSETMLLTLWKRTGGTWRVVYQRGMAAVARP